MEPQIPEICKNCIWGSGAILTYITWLLMVAGWGTLLWFVKNKFLNQDEQLGTLREEVNERFDKVEEKQDQQKELYHLCRTELPATFASKATVKELIGRIGINEKTIEGMKADIKNITKKVNNTK